MRREPRSYSLTSLRIFKRLRMKKKMRMRVTRTMSAKTSLVNASDRPKRDKVGDLYPEDALIAMYILNTVIYY